MYTSYSLATDNLPVAKMLNICTLRTLQSLMKQYVSIILSHGQLFICTNTVTK